MNLWVLTPTHLKNDAFYFKNQTIGIPPPARFLARPAGLLRHLAKFAYANRHTAVCLFAAVRTAFSQVQILGRLFQKSNHRHTAAGQIFGAPCRIRTCDLRIRNPMLYPAGLRARCAYITIYYQKIQANIKKSPIWAIFTGR